MNTWTYSHTQLSTYRACPRLYYDTYLRGIREKKTPNMAFGTFLLHGPIETVLRSGSMLDHDWELAWANFLAEFGGDETYDDPIFTLKTAKRCLSLYRESPVEGDVQAVEGKLYYEFPDGIRYVSIPDFTVRRGTGIPGGLSGYLITQADPVRRFTVDLKFTTQWSVKPLIPFDDQLIGQAICDGADGFIRVTFKADKKTGKVDTPRIEEHLLDPVLRDEWIEETWATCREIEAWRKKTHATWPKNNGHCYNHYGRDCPRLADCKHGFVPYMAVDKPRTV